MRSGELLHIDEPNCLPFVVAHLISVPGVPVHIFLPFSRSAVAEMRSRPFERIMSNERQSLSTSQFLHDHEHDAVPKSAGSSTLVLVIAPCLSLPEIPSLQDPKGVGGDHAGSPMQLQVSLARILLSAQPHRK